MIFTRELWLINAVEAMRPWFERAGYPLPSVRVSVGFPSRGKKTTTLGECWEADRSEDGTREIFISPIHKEPTEMLNTLLHELCHASIDKGGHGKAFTKVAETMGLEPPWKSAGGNAETLVRLNALCATLGKIDYGSLTMKDKTRVTQTTRMIKCTCETCGYVVRTTAKWLDDKGTPICPGYKGDSEHHGRMAAPEKPRELMPHELEAGGLL